MADQMLMKEGLNKQAIQRIAKGISAVYPSFESKHFEKISLKGLASLELKERVQHLIAQLQDCLPTDFIETSALLKALPEHWDRGDENDALRGFAAWPIIDYVAEAGLAHPDEAMQVFEKLTPLFSAEFAIRPFIQKHPKVTFKYLKRWLKHPDEHVRRLVSEGTRPRLPWGIRLQEFVSDPAPIWPLLEKLKADNSLYVRRSVANNLNDVAKDHPEKVLDICAQWKREYAEPKGKKLEQKENVEWVIRHATRTLVKQGHPKSFTLLGFTDKPSVTISNFKLDKKKVKLGEQLEFQFEILSNKHKQSFVVDYVVHFMKANGKTAQKVFKLKNCSMEKGEKVSLTKKIDFKPISTRKYYVGKHAVSINVNGVEVENVSFELCA